MPWALFSREMIGRRKYTNTVTQVRSHAAGRLTQLIFRRIGDMYIDLRKSVKLHWIETTVLSYRLIFSYIFGRN